MRLLNTFTLEVQEFLESRVPEYVILSHTWREEEVTLQDLLSGIAPTKKGYAKLTGCCKKAKDDGFAYCWIDTCCIDKTSSAELSEAINSMYQWYKNACICYAYLEDVRQDHETDDFRDFRNSKWFTRGWTLQELIAPPIVEFYDALWSDIGTRTSLQPRLTYLTGIDRDVLTGGDPLRYAVAVRLSWAANRQTSRLEDRAYCLFGILGVNMPLLYGEGKRAFRRLQEEMLRVDEDYTLFAWDTLLPRESLLASSPSDFETFTPVLNLVSAELADGGKIVLRDNLSKTCFSALPPPEDHSPPRLTSRGCHLSLPLFHYEEKSWYGCLACLERPKSDSLLLCVMLRQNQGSEYRFETDWDTEGEQSTLILLPTSTIKDFRYTSIYVITSIDDDHSDMSTSRTQDEGYSMVRVAIKPTLRSEIARFSFGDSAQSTIDLPDWSSDREHTSSGTTGNTARQLPTEEPYTGRENSVFEFNFDLKVGLTLRTFVYVRVNQNPYLSADIIQCIGKLDARPARLLRPSDIILPPLYVTPPHLPRGLPPQPKPDHALDRKVVQIQQPEGGKDFKWSIRLSIRRVASTPLEPSAKQYVLTLDKERSLTSEGGTTA